MERVENDIQQIDISLAYCVVHWIEIYPLDNNINCFE